MTLRTINVAQISRPLPWRPAATSKRSTEQVRPIFWSNRPRAYIKRTADWDSYPSGRWGNAASPAYGTLSDYQFMRRHSGSEKRVEKAKAAWGTSLTSLQDVYEVFSKYTSGAFLAVHLASLALTTLDGALRQAESPLPMAGVAKTNVHLLCCIQHSNPIPRLPLQPL